MEDFSQFSDIILFSYSTAGTESTLTKLNEARKRIRLHVGWRTKHEEGLPQGESNSTEGSHLNKMWFYVYQALSVNMENGMKYELDIGRFQTSQGDYRAYDGLQSPSKPTLLFSLRSADEDLHCYNV